MALIVVAALALLASAQTVQDVIDGRGCSTFPLSGLSIQLVIIANRSNPGEWANLRSPSYSRCVSLSDSAAAVPYLQHGAAGTLCNISQSRGSTIGINSGLRSLAQQLALYRWYKAGLCGIAVAAEPGKSNHNGGAAVDVSDSTGWRPYFLKNGWTWQGPGDRPHYNFVKAKDVRRSSVVAFQQLWNLNNPSAKIAVDGAYGPATEKALLQSPARGFAKF